MKKTLIGAIALALAVAAPARADWQFTKWGMSQAEFRQTAPIAITKSDYNALSYRCDNLLAAVWAIGKTPKYIVSSWQAGGFKFANCYIFDESNSLSDVFMILTDDSGTNETLLDTLKNKYGQPSDKSITFLNIDLFEWRTDKDLIKFRQDWDRSTRKTFIHYSSTQSSLANESKL
jgi:hypothetical protein